jgi:hypothetical protein
LVSMAGRAIAQMARLRLWTFSSLVTAPPLAPAAGCG